MNVAALLLVSAFAAYVQDGREWEDHLRQSHGKEPPHAAFGSFPDSAAARAVISSRSPWTVSLDSETAWRFKWSRRPSERPKGFEREGFDDSGWDIAKVPCSWQAMGIRKSGERFGVPIYLNQEYIFTPKFPANSNCWPKVTGHDLPRDWTFSCKDNPVGSYRREFSLDECWPDWAGERIVLRFDGVESFFYVYVNGQCLGYSKDSRDVSEFDITDVVRPGRNILAVEVYRNCDGSYLECQDMFRLSGIHRSVWLCRTPKTFIRDVGVTVAPASDGIYDGEWNVDVDVKIGGGTAAPKVEVSAPGGGSAVFKGGAFDAGGRTRLVFARPRLWSAETPELYTLVVSLERGGRTLTAAGFDLGFRESTIREGGTAHDRIYVFNGKAVKLKGVNRGECDPMFGHHVPAANIEADLKLIKRGNFNFVRNSHFPQTEYFYYLANRIGLYVMDEANIESHGYRYGKESLSHVRSWRDAHLARVRSMFMRSRNQPSVVLWSLGNEAGPGDNFRTCHDFIRSRDKMRPISYERNNEIADFGSCMYPTLELAHGIAIADGDVRLDNLPVRYPFLLLGG